MITRVKSSSVVQGLPKYRSMLAGNDFYNPPAYESIATVTASGGESSLSFSSISSSYTHLQVRMSNIKFQADQDIKVTFNSTGGTSYAQHAIKGDGSSASAYGSANTAYIDFLYTLVNDSATNSTPSVAIMDILDYADTNKFKTVRILWGGDYNGKGSIALQSGLFKSTSAISTITLAPFSTTFTAGCTFALYAIRGV